MNLGVWIDAIGGLALFLLAMQMMTEGLTVFAGRHLRELLERWTRTPLRGVAAGMLVTGVVQSSSAVTVATIGFVNAGVLNLRQALGVIYGANVGTTMTGWLVSAVGFGFKIEALALPILSAGVLFKLLGTNRRWQGLGVALAGFGLFFLGLGLLKDAFAGAAESFGARVVDGEFRLGLLGGLGIGFVATLLTQSSSAAIALILSAAASGVLGFDTAAAAVIGANIGTTSTAALAVLKATPAARRLALGHIVFNLLAGVVALLVLGPMLWLVQWLAAHVALQQGVAGLLALFHTVFNVLGVLLMLPLTEALARRLERWFVVQAEAAGRPQYLDHTLLQTPALALAAVLRELARMREQVREALRLAAVSTEPEAIRPLQESVRALGEAITQYVAELRGGVLEATTAQGVTRALAVVRNLREAARLAPESCTLRRELAHQPAAAVAIGLRQWLDGIATSVAGTDPESESAHLAETLERAHLLRLEVLEALVGGQLNPADVDRLLDALASVRRALTQWLEGLSVESALRTATDGPERR